MPLGSLLLHKAVDDLCKRRRVRIASCFACRHCFVKDGRADEQFHVLCKDRQDTRFIRFDESISITGNFHEDNCTMLYKNIQTTLPQHHISVIADGPYNSGILAVGPREGATFNYRAQLCNDLSIKSKTFKDDINGDSLISNCVDESIRVRSPAF